MRNYPPTAGNIGLYKLPPSATRVFRGGSFVNVAQDMRTGKRDTNTPSLRVYDYGVRCARPP